MPSPAHDIDSHYPLSADQIARYRDLGFIKLKNVLSPEALAFYGERITALTLDLNPRKGMPMEGRTTYDKAFIQVGNLWLRSHRVREFVMGKRLARIAAELMGTTGVRIWHDQALYKEAGGGFTPWHADQFYWPMATPHSCTAWIPLQATPLEMGPVAFAARSQHYDVGRDLAISDESEKAMTKALAAGGYDVTYEPFDLGEISFHMGWTFHRAQDNTTDQPRKVMTIIYMDEDMRLAKPRNNAQENDRKAWCVDTAIGEVMDSPITPVIWSSRTK
ncbi:MAG: phytanoyl-CoA dioxygenase family protein [Planctomycetota bacterium]|nr:phytanoyl-CoA dioxygenase family protein [Planctomycetota bacterium]